MTDTTRWRWLALVLLVVGALTFAACGDDDDDEGDGTAADVEAEEFPAGTTMAKLQDEGEIKIGVKYDVPPFGFLNPQTDEVEGFDVDIGQAIADKLGVEPNFIEAISDNRIPFLQDGTADVIISTMTITGERDQEIDFSEPYYVANGRVLVAGGSDIQGVEDLGDGDRVCTALGSTYADTLKQQAPEAKLQLVDSYPECLELLQNGAVDAISTDDVILTGMIIQDDTLELVGDQITVEPYGVGIKEGDTEMKEFIDEVLVEVKEDGRWEEIYQEWVGQYIPEDEHQAAPTMTLEEAIAVAPE